jgi:hypothetical protein
VQNQLPRRPNCMGAPPHHHEGVAPLVGTTPDGSAAFSGDLGTARYRLPRYLLRMPLLLLPTPLLGSWRRWAGQQGSQRTGWLPPWAARLHVQGCRAWGSGAGGGEERRMEERGRKWRERDRRGEIRHVGSHPHVASTSAKPATKTSRWPIVSGFKSWMVRYNWFWNSMVNTKLR